MKEVPSVSKPCAIHRAAPSYDELAASDELLETGIKVIDLVCPFAKGGKVGLFGGAGVGKTVNYDGAHQQYCDRALWSCPCSPVWVSGLEKETTSITRCRNRAL